MAKRGNRIQVILDVQSIRSLGNQELRVTLLQKIKKIRQIEWRLKNLIQFLNV